MSLIKANAIPIGVALAFALVACGTASPTDDRDDTPSRAALEQVEVLARTGTGREWQRSSAEEKRAFTLASVVGLGFETHPAREDLARDLRVCIDATAAATPDQPLAQLATDCVNQELRDDANAMLGR